MELVFWASFAAVAYAYFGYALALALFAVKHPVDKADEQPATETISILIAARNEEANLARKLENLRAQDYPAHHIQTIVVSDGSTDGTATLLAAHPEVTPILLPFSGGKAAALNQAVLKATGDILVFLDARQSLDPNAISELLACFADPTVGAVSGELLLESPDGRPTGDALGLYWKIEKFVRKLESETGSVVGVTGAIYAIRRELFVPMPPGLLLDDVFVPMNVARARKRVLFHSSAIARDQIFVQPGKEFSRKVRTLTGNYQLVQLAPWLLTPSNPLLIRFISHKLARLAVPLFLILMLLTSAVLLAHPFYKAILLAQLVFYGLALAGEIHPGLKQLKPIAIPNTFVMLNLAAAFAFYNFLTGRKAWG
jgi:biofilm PGA synthesis N-glycosyltransferase PgaC